MRSIKETAALGGAAAERVTMKTVIRAGASLALVCALLVGACAAPMVIHRQASPFSTITVTEGAQGLRTLYFDQGNVRQSVVKPGDPDHLELAYAKVAMVALAIVEAPRRILVVGLGGGTLPSFLRKHYPEAEIDAVEIDPVVVEVARQFLGFREDPRMRAHVADGRRFVEAARPRSYDLVFLDAFGAERVPPHLATREFLQSVRRALAPGGVAIGNVWGRRRNPLHDAMLRTYQDVFDGVYVMEAEGDVNNLFFCLERPRRLVQAELARAARRVSAAKGFRFDMGTLVERGFFEARARDPAARVLVDAELAPHWR
jgi:spermidine synthase